MNSFKVILTDSEDTGSNENVPIDHIGPPGGETLLAAIHREVGENAPDKAKIWATRAIFSQITHIALIVNSSWIKQHCCGLELFEQDYQRRTIKHVVSSFLMHIQSADWEKIEGV